MKKRIFTKSEIGRIKRSYVALFIPEHSRNLVINLLMMMLKF